MLLIKLVSCVVVSRLPSPPPPPSLFPPALLSGAAHQAISPDPYLREGRGEGALFSSTDKTVLTALGPSLSSFFFCLSFEDGGLVVLFSRFVSLSFRSRRPGLQTLTV